VALDQSRFLIISQRSLRDLCVSLRRGYGTL